MVLHLAEELDVPLRERNRMLVAAGFAPLYRETDLDSADLAPARDAIARILRAQDPYPAVVVNRWWDLVAGNTGIGIFLELLPDHLLAAPANVVRASLHPDGLAPHITNFVDYAGHMVGRVRRDLDITGDSRLADLLGEIRTYPGVSEATAVDLAPVWGGALLPLQLSTPRGEMSFFSTIATFGTPTDITLDELSIEMFFPADDATTAAVGRAGVALE